MKKAIDRIFILILLFVILFAFTASYTYDSIDNLAYVIAIGIDTTESSKIKVSFQFTDTSAYSDNSSSEAGGSIINTVEADSIESALNLMNSYTGKNINLAHCKVIVFSEDIAKKGLYNHIYSLINNSQIRPTSNIVISRCDAKYYIENSISRYEKIITKYYEIFPNSATYTGYVSDITLGEFFNQINHKTSNAVAILGGVNTDVLQNEISEQDDSNILANESSITGERGTENIGLAVFKDDVLVGELTAIDALCHSIISNEVNTFFISIPDPENYMKNLDLTVSPYKKTSVKVDVSSGSPYITIGIYLTAKAVSVSPDTNYLDENYLNSIKDSANHYLSARMSEYLYRTSTEFKACIDNFDKAAVHTFLTTNDWNNYNWSTSYPDSFFDININTNVNSSLLLTEG